MLIIYNFFFFNDTATTEIYTLSLHDALPIFRRTCRTKRGYESWSVPKLTMRRYLLRLTAASDCCERIEGDRKSTRLNSSHLVISYAVFCLKKKNNNIMYVTHIDSC